MSGDEFINLLLSQLCEHAIIALDPEGRIVGWYCGAETVFGYAKEEVFGRPSSILFSPEDIEKGMPSYEMAVLVVEREFRSGHGESDRFSHQGPRRYARTREIL